VFDEVAAELEVKAKVVEDPSKEGKTIPELSSLQSSKHTPSPKPSPKVRTLNKNKTKQKPSEIKLMRDFKLHPLYHATL